MSQSDLFANVVKGLSKILAIRESGKSLDDVDVSSSAIDTISYDYYTKILTIKFLESQSEYSYAMIDEATANSFINSASIGKYFNSEIKGNYIYWRLS